MMMMMMITISTIFYKHSDINWRTARSNKLEIENINRPIRIALLCSNPQKIIPSPPPPSSSSLSRSLTT
jgi:hypothetical protein